MRKIMKLWFSTLLWLIRLKEAGAMAKLLWHFMKIMQDSKDVPNGIPDVKLVCLEKYLG